MSIICVAVFALAGCGGGSTTTPPPVATTPAPTPVPPPGPTSPYPTGMSAATITVGGVQRDFLVYRPVSSLTPRAILFVLHGGTGSAAQASNLATSPQAVFRTIADREGFIVIYPDGLSNNWNDCRADAPGLSGTGDDVAFFDALISRLQGEFSLDSRRVFLSGTSNGAMMSIRYALERADRIGGIAVSSGNIAATPKSGRCTDGPTRAVPILMTHGTVDDVVPYGGGCVAQSLTGICTQGRVISAEATRDRWIGYNSLAGVVPQTTRVEIATDDGGAANQFRYLGPTPVEWWRLEGAGHSPPSRTVFLDRTTSGQQNHDVEFAEIAWTFIASRLP